MSRQRARNRYRGEIHLGDLARALAELPWQDPTQVAAIARCLGFGLEPKPAMAPTSPRRVHDRQGVTPPTGTQRSPAEERPIFMPPAPPRPISLPEGTLPVRLIRRPGLAPPNTEPSDWLAEGTRAFPADPEPALSRATLLPERTARHVLSAALATFRSGEAVHVPCLIDAICRRQILLDLPRRMERTLVQGCQLLLDYSSSMVPFWEDLSSLAGQVQQVIGDHSTRVYSFDSRPTLARRWTSAGEPEPWIPDGRPVLAATDLGIQGPAPVGPDPDWNDFAARCAAAGSMLYLLIPWPEERWPRTFPANATLIPWGPHTTAGMVRCQSARWTKRP